MLPSLPSCTQRDGHLLTPMLAVLSDSYNFSFSSSSETTSYLYLLPKPSFPPTFLLYFISAPRTDISLRQISTAAPSICSIYPCLDRVLSSHFLWLPFPLLLFLCPHIHQQRLTSPLLLTWFICLFGLCRNCHSHTPSSPKVQTDLKEQLLNRAKQKVLV